MKTGPSHSILAKAAVKSETCSQRGIIWYLSNWSLPSASTTMFLPQAPIPWHPIWQQKFGQPYNDPLTCHLCIDFLHLSLAKEDLILYSCHVPILHTSVSGKPTTADVNSSPAYPLPKISGYWVSQLKKATFPTPLLQRLLNCGINMRSIVVPYKNSLDLHIFLQPLTLRISIHSKIIMACTIIVPYCTVTALVSTQK